MPKPQALVIQGRRRAEDTRAALTPGSEQGEGILLLGKGVPGRQDVSVRGQDHIWQEPPQGLESKLHAPTGSQVPGMKLTVC